MATNKTNLNISTCNIVIINIDTRKGEEMNNVSSKEVYTQPMYSGPSLKEKYAIVEDSLKKVNDEYKAFKKDSSNLIQHKDKIEKLINSKADSVKDNLKNEIGKIDDEMKKHFSHHKAENSRLQQQIAQLKGEKTTISSLLKSLEKRIYDISLQIGTEV